MLDITTESISKKIGNENQTLSLPKPQQHKSPKMPTKKLDYGNFMGRERHH